MDVRDIQQAILAGHMLAGKHAIDEAMSDGLLLDEIWASLLSSGVEMVEDYPTDPRGPSCLLYCEIRGKFVHAVIAYPSQQAAQQRGYASLVFLVTCYRPDDPKYANKWTPDFKKRATQ